jgi:hypothetical protein
MSEGVTPTYVHLLHEPPPPLGTGVKAGFATHIEPQCPASATPLNALCLVAKASTCGVSLCLCLDF